MFMEKVIEFYVWMMVMFLSSMGVIVCIVIEDFLRCLILLGIVAISVVSASKRWQFIVRALRPGQINRYL